MFPLEVFVFLPQEKAKPIIRQGRKAKGFYETSGVPKEVTRFFLKSWMSRDGVWLGSSKAAIYKLGQRKRRQLLSYVL